MLYGKLKLKSCQQRTEAIFLKRTKKEIKTKRNETKGVLFNFYNLLENKYYYCCISSPSHMFLAEGLFLLRCRKGHLRLQQRQLESSELQGQRLILFHLQILQAGHQKTGVLKLLVAGHHEVQQ